MAIFKTNYPVPDPNVYGINSATKPKAGTIFPLQSWGVATNNSPELWNPWARGVRLFIVITVQNGGTATVKIQVKDPVSGNFIDLAGATSAALSGSNQNAILTVYPGVAESATVDISDPLGTGWRVVNTVGTAAVTMSVGGDYLI